MPVVAHHHMSDVDAASTGELQHTSPRAGIHQGEATATVVELSVFKRSAPASERELSNITDARSDELVLSLLEELRQARFREARGLRRFETLEREIRVARAQNQALRATLDGERCAAIAPPGGSSDQTSKSAPGGDPIEETVAAVPPPGLGRSFLGRFRDRFGIQRTA